MIDATRRIVADPRGFAAIALTILLSTLWAYSQLYVWEMDAIPNLRTFADPSTGKVSTIDTYLRAEGRWLHELLRPILGHVGGTVAVFVNLTLFFCFIFIAAKRYTSDVWHSFAFAALCVQSPPLAHHLLWPVITLPSFLFLFVAATTVRVLGTLPFYLIFGILFSGSFSHLYFMLPLLHLPLLSSTRATENFKTLSTRIAPPWISGFVLGWMVNMAIVYLWTLIDSGEGQIGLDIAEWRKVAGAEPGAWGITAWNSVESLYLHMSAMLASNIWLIFAALGALIPGMLVDRRHLPAKILFAGILLACYISTIPIGISVDFRTAVPTAIAVAALLFLVKFSEGGWKDMSIRVTLLLFSFGWALETIDNKLYRSAITGAWVDSLVRIAPEDPSLYKGVVLLNADPSMIGAATRAIEEKLDLPHRNAIHDYMRWASTALAAGFDNVALCDGGPHISRRSLCGAAEILCEPRNGEESGDVGPYGLYDLRCVLDGNLVVAIDRRFLSDSTPQRIGAAIADTLEGGGRLVAEGKFDIYLKNRRLYYVKDPCTQADIGGKLFLFVTPKDVNDLPEERVQYGWDNVADTKWADVFVRGACVMVAQLPDYPISSVITGQYIPGQPAVWEVELMIENERLN